MNNNTTHKSDDIAQLVEFARTAQYKHHEYSPKELERLCERVELANKVDDTTHNGWTNYATWRVNLECVDSISWVREDITGDETQVLTTSDIADFLKNAVTEMVGEHGERDSGLAYEYACAFLGLVNWYEIAEHFAETYPSIMTNDN